MDYILTTDKITKKFKSVTAVNEVSIHVARGEVYGLIGRNGAGKTTLLRMLATLSFPTSGTFSIFGRNGETKEQMLPRIGVLIEDPGFFQNLSAFQNLKAKALAFGVKDDAYLEKLLVDVGLAAVRNKTVKTFSLGMKQRLGIAIAMVNSPELLILDEPINGLDPQGIAEIRQLIRSLCETRQISIIISSHILDELAKVADRYGIIHQGKLLDEATNAELVARCQSYAFIRTDNVQGTINVLAQMGIMNYVFNQDHFEIRERVNEIGKISMELAKANIQTLEMRTEGQSLEDYYFRLTGGNENV